MIILALDLGTNTGFALSHLTNGVVSGSYSCQMKKQDHPGVRYLKFAGLLSNLYEFCAGIDAVYYEQVRRHAGTDAAHVYGGFQAHLQAWCARLDIPCHGVPVGTIKKHATGKGNANKQEMIDAAVRAGHTPKNDNEADALALLYYAFSKEKAP